jgi:hypothetical protein
MRPIRESVSVAERPIRLLRGHSYLVIDLLRSILHLFDESPRNPLTVAMTPDSAPETMTEQAKNRISPCFSAITGG